MVPGLVLRFASWGERNGSPRGVVGNKPRSAGRFVELFREVLPLRLPRRVLEQALAGCPLQVPRLPRLSGRNLKSAEKSYTGA